MPQIRSTTGKRPPQVVAIAAIAALAAAAATVRSADAALVYGVTLDHNLFSFDSANPSVPLSGVFITGLQPNESIQGIDFRPATGQLYAVGSTSRVYTLNTSTGAATPVGSGFAPPVLNGTSFGMDFNPVVDRIRLVSDLEQNLRLDPNTGGLTAQDTNLAYAAGDPNAGANPNVVGAAYTNNFPGTQTTALYGIDTNLDTLVLINPPNAGTVNTVGALGVNVSNFLGFDILGEGSGGFGNAFAAMQEAPNGVSQLYTINLATGAATLVGTITGGNLIRDISVVIPEPGTLTALLGIGAVGLLSRRRP